MAGDARNRQRTRRQDRNTPSRDTRRRLPEITGFRLSPPSSKRDADRTLPFGGQLQSARCGHRQVSHLGYDRAETAMSQALLETGEQGLFIARLDMNQPIGSKPRLCQRRGKQVGARDTPKDFAAGPRCNPSRKQPGRGAIDGAISTTGNLMQTAHRQPAAGKTTVDIREPEWQGRPSWTPTALDALDALPKVGDSRTDGLVRHGELAAPYGFATGPSPDTFFICSRVGRESIGVFGDGLRADDRS